MGVRIKAEIALVSDDRNLLQSQSSLIQQNANNILLRVLQTDYNGEQIVSRINIAPSSIKIDAKNIDISGLVTVTNFTYANIAGAKPPTDADRTSTVIDGGLVTTGTIQVGSGASVRAGIRGGGTDGGEIRFWAGSTLENRHNAPFRVTQDGAVVMNNAVVTGAVHATSGNFTGAVNATSGKIARFDINADDLIYTSELFFYSYDMSDVNRLQRILVGSETATPYDLFLYTLGEDQEMSILDLVLVHRAALGMDPSRRRIRSIVRIGTNNGALTTQAQAENGVLGPLTTMRGGKITSALINADSISTVAFQTQRISIGESTFNLTRDSNGFLKATS